MIVFFTDQIDHSQAKLENDEFTHCIKVLRHKLNDPINLVDGKGSHFKGKISTISKKECLIDILEVDKQSESPIKKAIAIAPTKNISRFEWFLEKSTEIGITDIYPIIYKQSERKHIKAQRANKIVRSAFKQCLRYYEPVLHPLMEFSAFCHSEIDYEQKFIAHFDKANDHIKEQNKQQSTIVLIGPEGDFRPDEIEAAVALGYKNVNISDNRLRTETAGLVALNFIV